MQGKGEGILANVEMNEINEEFMFVEASFVSAKSHFGVAAEMIKVLFVFLSTSDREGSPFKPRSRHLERGLHHRRKKRKQSGSAFDPVHRQGEG